MTRRNNISTSIFYTLVIFSASLFFYISSLSDVKSQELIYNNTINNMASFNFTEIQQKNKLIIDKVTENLDLSNLPLFEQNEKTLIYKNDLTDVQIQYPQKWLVSTSGLNSPNDLVSFIPPLDNLSDTSQGRLIVSIAKFNQNISIQEFKELSKQITESNTNSPGFQILKNENSSLMGLPAYTILSLNTFNFPTQILELNTWVVDKENTLYTVSYISQPDKFIKYKDEVLKIINSITLLN